MIYLIRHGERADNSNLLEERQKVKNPADPHLTALGEQQARKAGEVLGRLTKESISNGILQNKKYKYMIVSSPFLRCIQTSMNIMKSLNPNDIYENSIFIQPGASEILYKNWFSENIFQELTISKTTDEEFEAEYGGCNLKFNKIDESSCYPLQYPEDEQQYYNRICSFYETAANSFVNNQANEGVILIMVTHGWAIHAVLGRYGAYEYNLGVDYCSINQLFHANTACPPAILAKQYHCHLYDV